MPTPGKGTSSGNRIIVGVTVDKSQASFKSVQKDLNEFSQSVKLTPIVDFADLDKLQQRLADLERTQTVHLTIDDSQLTQSLANASKEYVDKFADIFNEKAAKATTDKLSTIFSNLNTTLKEYYKAGSDANKILAEFKTTTDGIDSGSGGLQNYVQNLEKAIQSFEKFGQSDFATIQETFVKIADHVSKNPINFKVGFEIRKSAQELQRQARSIQHIFNKTPEKTSGLGTVKGVNTIQFGASFREDAAKQLIQKVSLLQKQLDETDKTAILFDITPDKLLQDLSDNIKAVNDGLAKPDYQLHLKLNNQELAAKVNEVEILLKQCVKDANEAISALEKSRIAMSIPATDDTKAKKSRSKKKEIESQKADLADLGALQKDLTEQFAKLNAGLANILIAINEQKEQGIRLDEKALEVLKKQTKEIEKQENIAGQQKKADDGSSSKTKTLTNEQLFKKMKSTEKLILDAQKKLSITDPTNEKLVAANKAVLDNAEKRYAAELKTLNVTKAQAAELRKNLELQRAVIIAESEQEQATARIQDYRNKTNKALQTAEELMTNLATMADQHKFDNIEDIDKKLEQILALVEKIRDASNTIFDNLDADETDSFADDYTNLKEMVEQAKLLARPLKASHTHLGHLSKDVDKLNNLSADLVRYMNKYGDEIRKNQTLYNRFLELQRKLQTSEISASNAQLELKQLQREARAAGVEVDTLWKKLKRTFGSRVRSALSGQGVFLISASLRQVYQNVLQLDTAMTELRKVTNATNKEYVNFLKDAEVRAKKLGATLVDTTSATADMARLGYNIKDASALADTALIYQNVGDGVESIDDATSSIISTMQAFGIEAQNSMRIVDKFNAIGNRFATTSGDVGEALKRSASAMEAANNSLDETIALYTAAQTTVQDADVVGTALKTLSLRIRGAESELEEAGLETEGMADSTSKLRAEVEALTGVDIMLDDTTFKSTYQILKEISEVWDQITDVSQANVLELLFAKRQSNIGAAILKDFDIAEEALKVAAESTGSALKENQIYLESMQGRLDKLTATWQSLSNNILDDSDVKTAISSADKLLGIVNTLVDKLGVMPGLIAAIGTAWAKSNAVGKECALLYQAA